MNVIPGWKYISAGVGIAVLLLVGWWAAKIWWIEPSDLPDAEGQALELACTDLAKQLGEYLNVADRGYLTLSIYQVRNDTKNKQTQKKIADLLGDDPRFKIVANDILEDIGEGISGALPGSGDSTPLELLRDQGELDAVLAPTLEKKGATSTEATVKLSAKLYLRDAEKPHTMQAIGTAKLSHAQEEAEDKNEGSFWGDLWWSFWRMMVSIIGAGAIPFVFLPATDWITKRGSNALGMTYLGLVIVASMLPWFVLMGADAQGGTLSIYIFGVFLLIASSLWTYRMHDAWSDRI